MGAFLLKLQLLLKKHLETDILDPPDHCILWRGALDADGYSKIRVKWIDGSNKVMRGHRLAYMIFMILRA